MAISAVTEGDTDRADGPLIRDQAIHDIEEFREGLRHLYTVEPAGTPGDLVAKARFIEIDGTRFTEGRLSGIRLSRPKALIDRVDPNFIWIRLCRGGSTRHVFDGDVVPFEPGMIHIGDYSCEMDSYPQDLHHVGATLPYEAIGFDRARHRPHLRFDEEGPVRRLLLTAMLAHFEQLPTASGPEATVLTRGFCGLLRGILDGAAKSDQDADILRTRAEAMRAFLDARLSDPMLGPACLAEAFEASRTTIYRAFAQWGGVRAYIQTARLERAHADLAASPGSRGLVTRVAEKWGYWSVSQFSRAFQDAFGYRPSSVVGSARQSSGQIAPGR